MPIPSWSRQRPAACGHAGASPESCPGGSTHRAGGARLWAVTAAYRDHPASANYSRFSRIFAGDIGLDLYTHAVSNVYQDLFGSGSYIGKGIYDVDAFETSLAGRVQRIPCSAMICSRASMRGPVW